MFLIPKEQYRYTSGGAGINGILFTQFNIAHNMKVIIRLQLEKKATH